MSRKISVAARQEIKGVESIVSIPRAHLGLADLIAMMPHDPRVDGVNAEPGEEAEGNSVVETPVRLNWMRSENDNGGVL